MSGLNIPTLPPIGSSSATGNPRNKVALQPGRSLMDWIRLGNSGKDLTGIGRPGGEVKGVTTSELAKHNTEKDAWIAVRGKVYNITPYFEFHPGGIPELMRGMGKDATDMFDEIHKWVNIESMLAKCYIGKYNPDFLVPSASNMAPPNRALLGVAKPVVSSALRPPQFTDYDPSNSPVLLNVSSTSEKFATPAIVLSAKTSSTPRYEWFQTDDTVVIVIYTKSKFIKRENVLVDKISVDQKNSVNKSEKESREDGKSNLSTELDDIKVSLPVDNHLFTIHLNLHSKVSSENYGVKVGKQSGKVDLTLQKIQRGVKWTVLGEPASEEHNSYIPVSESNQVYRDCRISSKCNISHDTVLYTVKFPPGSRVCVPVGHHVYVKAKVMQMEINRAYTPVVMLSQPENKDGQIVHLMIKIYQDGALTPVLSKLAVDDRICISSPQGDFDEGYLEGVNDLTLLAAGTGFTPMTSVIEYVLKAENAPKTNVTLIFFNKTEMDILWKDALKELQIEHPNFKVSHVLSQPSDEWSGLKGRIREDIMKECVLKPDDKSGSKAYVCVCGPDPFTDEAVRLAKEYGFKDSMIHAFRS